MSFTIIKSISIPAAATRNRPRGPLAQALDSLEVGDGFEYPSEGNLKSQYPKVAPKKFGGVKRFKVWASEGKEGFFTVARLADGAADEVTEEDKAADAAAAAGQDNDE